jgi:hypothetical protein
MKSASELLNYWNESPFEGYTADEKDIVKEPLNNVEDASFAFIMGLMYFNFITYISHPHKKST